jgi:hypothetical protein
MKPTKKMAPHLIERDGQKACSACGTIFTADGEISISRAFVTHVRSKHGQEADRIAEGVKKPLATSRLTFTRKRT